MSDSPMFTTQMFHNLGYNWAASIPAFLSLACAPFPFLFKIYGARIRASCKYSAEADKIMAAIMSQMAAATQKEDPEKNEPLTTETPEDAEERAHDSEDTAHESPGSLESQEKA